VLPVRLAFLEWSRKSELSADRAGLLGGQDILVAQRLDMKMAGGGRGPAFEGQLDVEAFMRQAHEYANSSEGLDVVYKLLSTLALTHPMHTVRAAELQRWVRSGEYDRIASGEYVRRGQEGDWRAEADAATQHYTERFRGFMDEAAEGVAKLGDGLGDASGKLQDWLRWR
jgi:hypothetical protein